MRTGVLCGASPVGLDMACGLPPQGTRLDPNRLITGRYHRWSCYVVAPWHHAGEKYLIVGFSDGNYGYKFVASVGL